MKPSTATSTHASRFACVAAAWMHSLTRDGCRHGIVALCNGSGRRIALAIEML